MRPYEVGSMTGVWAGNSLNSELLLAVKTAGGPAFSSKSLKSAGAGSSPALVSRGGSPGDAAAQGLPGAGPSTRYLRSSVLSAMGRIWTTTRDRPTTSPSASKL